jgi:hypothetical protein
VNGAGRTAAISEGHFNSRGSKGAAAAGVVAQVLAIGDVEGEAFGVGVERDFPGREGILA